MNSGRHYVDDFKGIFVEKCVKVTVLWLDTPLEK
jgi:hypothetical protein